MIKYYILGSTYANSIFRTLRGSTYTDIDDVIDEMLDPKTWRKISEFSIKSEKRSYGEELCLTGKYVNVNGEEEGFELSKSGLVTKIKEVLSNKVENSIAFSDVKLEGHLCTLAEILFSDAPCTGKDFVNMEKIEKIYEGTYKKDTSNKYNEACYKYITGLINLIKKADDARVKAVEDGIKSLFEKCLETNICRQYTYTLEGRFETKDLRVNYCYFRIVMNYLVSNKKDQLKKICSARMLKRFAEEIESKFEGVASAKLLSKKLTEQANDIQSEDDDFDKCFATLKGIFSVKDVKKDILKQCSEDVYEDVHEAGEQFNNNLDTAPFVKGLEYTTLNI